MNRLINTLHKPLTTRFRLMTTTSHQAPEVSLISPAQAHSLGLANYKILDASFHLPNTARSASDEFRNRPRLPNARFFDHDLVADTSYTVNSSHKLAHMQPNLDTFKHHIQRLGISRNDHILVYDSIGIFSAPRAAWLLNSYGHPKVSVLDGGLPRWIHENLPLESGPAAVDPDPSEYDLGGFDESQARSRVISYEALVENVRQDHPRSIVFDARPRGRFLGIDPEPRPGIPSGHIPKSISLPFTKLLTPPSPTVPPYRTLLPHKALEKVFLSECLQDDLVLWDRIKDGHMSVVVSCGSGLTACVVWLALLLCRPSSLQLSHKSALDLKLYDESWAGYALRPDALIINNSLSK